MKTRLAFAIIILISLSLVPTLTFASPVVQQTQPPCPTYQTNIEVDFVDSNPHTAPVGTLVVTLVHVIYPDGTPVTNLSPLTMSFLWTGPSGKTQLDNQQVTPVPGRPGYYNYTAPLTPDIVQATGQGQLTLSVATCSCSDGSGNRGPTGVVSSLETIVAADDSRVAIEVITPPAAQNTSTLFPLVILALLVIALLALLMRRRRKKT